LPCPLFQGRTRQGRRVRRLPEDSRSQRAHVGTSHRPASPGCEDWDYAVIQHLGTKATVEAAGTAVPAAMRDLSAWHTDSFANGPSWPDFTKALGIDEGSAAKTSGAVYVVSVYRAAPGHRELLEKSLSQNPRGNTVS